MVKFRMGIPVASHSLVQKNWSAAIWSKKLPKYILINYYKQQYYLLHMLVHIFIISFYKPLVSKTIFPSYCFSPNYFFPPLFMLQKSLGEKPRVKLGRKQVNSFPDSTMRLWREAILFFWAIIWISRYGEDALSSPGAFGQSPLKQAL